MMDMLLTVSVWLMMIVLITLGSVSFIVSAYKLYKAKFDTDSMMMFMLFSLVSIFCLFLVLFVLTRVVV